MSNIFYAFFIATVFVSWPIIGKYSGISAIWIAFIVSVSTMIPIAVLSRIELLDAPKPALRAVMILVISGIANGIGFYLYTQKVSDTSVQTGTFVVTVSVLMVILTPLMSWMINGEILTPKQYAGFALALLAIYLIILK